MLKLLLTILSAVLVYANDYDDELTRLDEQIAFQMKKVNKLKELRNMFITEEKSDLEDQKKMINKVLNPELNQPPKVDQLTPKAFMNRVMKKFSIKHDKFIKKVIITNTQSYKSSLDTQMNQVLVTIGEDSVNIYDMNGIMIQQYNTDQQNVELIAVSGRQDDPIIATYGNGNMTIYKFEAIKEQGQDNQQKIKLHCVFESSFQVTQSQISDVVYSTSKSNRYFIFSDSKGALHVYHRNGSFVGSNIVQQSGIISLIRSFPNTLFASNLGIGFFNPITLQVAPPYCESVPTSLIQVTLDVQQNNVVYALTEAGVIYVYEIRYNEGGCKVRHKIQLDAEFVSKNLEITSLRYFLIVTDRETTESRVFNSSEFLSDGKIDDPVSLNLVNSKGATIQSVRGQGSSHYLAMLEHNEDQSQSQVSYFEVSIPLRKESDFFSTYRWFILAAAAGAVILYQRRRSQSQKNDKTKKGDKNEYFHEDREIEELLGKRGINLGKPGQPRSAADEQKLKLLAEQLEALDRKQKNMTDMISKQKKATERSAATAKKMS